MLYLLFCVIIFLRVCLSHPVCVFPISDISLMLSAFPKAFSSLVLCVCAASCKDWQLTGNYQPVKSGSSYQLVVHKTIMHQVDHSTRVRSNILTHFVLVYRECRPFPVWRNLFKIHWQDNGVWKIHSLRSFHCFRSLWNASFSKWTTKLPHSSACDMKDRSMIICLAAFSAWVFAWWLIATDYKRHSNLGMIAKTSFTVISVEASCRMQGDTNSSNGNWQTEFPTKCAVTQ